MYIIKKEWKEFNIHLPTVQEACSLFPNFCGLSADSCLKFYFTSEPSDSDKAALDAYYEALSAESPEALNYKSQADIAAKIAELKLDAISKTYDQLSIAQKKLLMGLEVSRAELFA